jgi:hypothetical protein
MYGEYPSGYDDATMSWGCVDGTNGWYDAGIAGGGAYGGGAGAAGACQAFGVVRGGAANGSSAGGWVMFRW